MPSSRRESQSDFVSELSRSAAERIMDQAGLHLYHIQKASHFLLERISQLTSVTHAEYATTVWRFSDLEITSPSTNNLAFRPDSLSWLTASVS